MRRFDNLLVGLFVVLFAAAYAGFLVVLACAFEPEKGQDRPIEPVCQALVED